MKLFSLFCAAVLCIAPTLATATPYPNQNIRLVVPFPPGGGTDATARLIANELSPLLGQNVIVENRPGAGGGIGAQAVASAQPDGYTLFFSTTGALVINPHLYPDLRYSLESFTPIATIGTSANVLVVRPNLPINSISELITYAKKHPEELTYGSSGMGSSSHLAGVMLESLADIRLRHIPYKGSAPAVTDLVGGRIDMMIDNIPSHAELARAGKVRPLGLSGLSLSPLFPDTRPINETVNGYDVSIWYAILGPAGTPASIVETLNTAINSVIAQAKTAEALITLGSEPLSMSPAQFSDFLQTEDTKWAAIVKQSGANIEN